MCKAASGTLHSCRMWKPVTTTLSKLVWHWKVPRWRWLTVLHGLGFQLHSVPYKGCFLFMWQTMSRFSGIPDTVVERINFDLASCIPHLCQAMVTPNTRRHSNVLQNTRGDQNMEKIRGKPTYSVYPFIHLTVEGTTVQEHPDNSEKTVKWTTNSTRSLTVWSGKPFPHCFCWLLTIWINLGLVWCQEILWGNGWPLTQVWAAKSGPPDSRWQLKLLYVPLPTLRHPSAFLGIFLKMVNL